MRIDQLFVQNFKMFEERTFSFHPSFNLVVGKNGTGKTSLLEALSVSLGSWFLGFRDKLESRSIQRHEPRLVLYAGEHGARFESQVPVLVRAKGEVAKTPVEWSRSLEHLEGNTRHADAEALKRLARQADDELRQGQENILPLISFYGAGRLWLEPRDMQRESRIDDPLSSLLSSEHLSRLKGYDYSIDSRISIKSLIRWFARQTTIALQRRIDATPSLQAVKTAIISCLEGARDLVFDLEKGQLLLDWGATQQPFANLSDGQRALLALVADLAIKADWLNPHLGARVLEETPGVVLIDELDLHLHPRWQRRITEDLRRVFPSLQWICTSHSPFLIQSLRSGDELLMLEGQPTASLGHQGIEEIARGLMAVDRPEVSLLYAEMKEVAAP